MDVENKMVIDSLWNDLDEIDEQEREEMEEAFWRKVEEEREEAECLFERGLGHMNGYYL